MQSKTLLSLHRATLGATFLTVTCRGDYFFSFLFFFYKTAPQNWIFADEHTSYHS